MCIILDHVKIAIIGRQLLRHTALTAKSCCPSFVDISVGLSFAIRAVGYGTIIPLVFFEKRENVRKDDALVLFTPLVF